jgi:hypothetical protein
LLEQRVDALAVDAAKALGLHVPVGRLQGAGDETVDRQGLEVIGAAAQVVEVQAAALAGRDDEGGGAAEFRAGPEHFRARAQRLAGQRRRGAR